VLGTIPLKGQVLNRMAQFWFEQTADIAPNHVLEIPDPNVTVARELQILPVEVVVRGYLTGSSDTAIWTHYSQGVRQYCGICLPDGMVKNQPLEAPVITPTTKSDTHDEPISREQILARGLVAEATWEQVERIALALFERGTQLAARQGLILVDTKYEMGLAPDEQIVLADEIHTPDSSRYWMAASYPERHRLGQEPESLDKEFLRLWLRERGISDTYLPPLDDDIRIEVAERYMQLFGRVTGQPFAPELGDQPVLDRIRDRIARYFE
jgi:phosphoribosylaminoimidazole-succinocarboxamide synthase